jgi:hypothetical protein
MDVLLSPTNVEKSNKNPFTTSNTGELDDDEMGPQDDYIIVKIYFYGTDKPLRTRVFPQI